MADFPLDDIVRTDGVTVNGKRTVDMTLESVDLSDLLDELGTPEIPEVVADPEADPPIEGSPAVPAVPADSAEIRGANIGLTQIDEVWVRVDDLVFDIEDDPHQATLLTDLLPGTYRFIGS